MIPRLIRDLIDFCYPGLCARCGNGNDPSAFLCTTCLSELIALEKSAACPLCGAPLAEDGAPCPFCEGKGVPHYDTILRLGIFDDPLKDLIHKMKYQGRWTVCERLADRLMSQEKIRALLAQADVLVPVPLHPFRQFNRGYNQAAVIARRLGKASHKPIARPLRRVRHTETQTHLHSRQKRFENLNGAFRLSNAKSIAGKRVLVIDDVMTTGATLQIVARTLRPANPESLSALVVAVADPRGRSFEVV